mgnify:CR=1 FL=1
MQVICFEDARKLSSKEIRKKIRLELYNNHTSGLATNKLQANIVILPKEYTTDLSGPFVQKNIGALEAFSDRT